MSRQKINRALEMEVFVAVVAAEGFTAAAEPLGMTASAVSKLIHRLETRLGTKLLHRTTCKLQLTPEGSAFHERCLRILDDIDCAEHEAAQVGSPRGRMRVNSQVAFGVHYLLPCLAEFLQRYPDVQLDVTLSDIVVVASPDYLRRAGMPDRPKDLHQHRRLAVHRRRWRVLSPSHRRAICAWAMARVCARWH